MQESIAARAKSALVGFAALASWAVPAFAQPPASERTAATLMAVEHQWLAALHRHDVTTLARILGREFIDSDFQGDAISRAQYLAFFAHPAPRSPPAVEQNFEDTQVRFIAGGEVAIVTGIVTRRPSAKAHGSSSSPAVRYSRFTDVFVWRDGRWQAVSGQETHFHSPHG